MARKIFVSYKYGDTQVEPLEGIIFEATKARDYVTKLQELLSDNDQINKGEKDDEDLSNFKDSTIESKLRDKIFDSSITIAIVSKGMKEYLTAEKDQWMPWEIAYSLRTISKGDRTSNPNGVIMVVLPDNNGSYDYYITDNTCPYCDCRSLSTDFLFGILKRNTFNNKSLTQSDCEYHSVNPVYTGDHSYIMSVKWVDFIKTPNFYLDECARLRDNIDDFNISKTISGD